MTKMFNCLRLQLSKNKSLLLAVIISLLLHTLLISKFSLSLPALNDEPQTLEMRIVKLQPTKNSVPEQSKNISVEPKSPSPKKQPKNTNAVSDPAQKIGQISDSAPIVETPNISASNNVQETEPSTLEPSTTETIDSTTSNKAANVAEQITSHPFKYVETAFEIHRGNDASTSGAAIISFRINEDSTYSISSTTEAKGLASLIFSKLKQTSEGSVTENGLRPSRYQYQYGNDAKKLQIANFAWSDSIVEMTSAKGTKTERISEGTQDFLSFMYQFMFSPPLTNMQITMSNGKNLRTYTYSFEGEVNLITKIGNLKTVHLLRSGSDEEKTELWLAIDYKYLPVKIRKTEKDGSVIEQTAIKIVSF